MDPANQGTCLQNTREKEEAQPAVPAKDRGEQHAIPPGNGSDHYPTTTGKSRGYLLITPMKNEETHIGKCIRSVTEQTLPPSLWILVDDGSTDGSAGVVRTWTDHCPWIRLISLGPGEWDLGIHYSEVCIRGFDRAQALAREESIRWGFMGLLDADIVPEKDYFERLIEWMDSEPRVGIASGCLRGPGEGGAGQGERGTEGPGAPGDGKERGGWDGDRSAHPGIPVVYADKPMGAARLWRRECFEVAPYIPSYAPDSVSNIKANLAGWDTRMYGDIHGHQLRRMGTSQGRCRGAQLWGKSSHFLGSGPLFGLLKGVKLMTRYPCYPGLCYLLGYFTSWLKRQERISDPAVIEFYAQRRLRDYLGRRKKIIRT